LFKNPAPGFIDFLEAHLIHRHHRIVMGPLKQKPKEFKRKIALTLRKTVLREKQLKPSFKNTG
uniref:Uncharacterized protein n=1 Tax=Piliocolobus tephrosceles TaxID=591936 RepID=A0A8C9GZT3_9PRIM